MSARIYRPSQSVTQCGKGNSKAWVLEFEPRSPKLPDPLMGWVGSDDTQQQLKLSFATQAEAETYAKRKNIEYTVIAEAPKKPSGPKNYADNFRFDKLEFGRF